MSLGLVVTLSHETACVNCEATIEVGEMAKCVRGYFYEHLNCEQHIDLDEVKASKSQHPANQK